jgi:hypothetical protein
MAEQKMILTDKGVGRYGTRMLKAGDEIALDGPRSRLFHRMGWARTTSQPRVKEPVSMKLTKPELLKLAEAEGVEVFVDDTKADLVSKIETARG